MRRVTFVGLITTGLLLACEPERLSAPVNELGVQPLCQVGCVEDDPYPGAPGVFLGSGVTPAQCFDWGTDADSDGLSDFCEKQLMFAFNPELRYDHLDYVDREPYWAASPTGDEGDPIRIVYLLSYYRDNGSDAYLCSLPFHPASCDGHNGDSEAVAFDVYYDAVHQHWLMHAAYYSQHGDLRVASREGSEAYPRRVRYGTPTHYTWYSVQYPEHPGSYMRVYVSEGKHANYYSTGDCEEGGAFQSDTCADVDTSVRDVMANVWNIGSRQHQLINCVEARSPAHPYYGSHRAECYWAPESRFRGWFPLDVGGDDASPYEVVLTALGF
jgi:hypothetical protein